MDRSEITGQRLGRIVKAEIEADVFREVERLRDAGEHMSSVEFLAYVAKVRESFEKALRA